MALAQVERLRNELAVLRPDIALEVVSLTTSGDRWQGDLAALGGKGAFTSELEVILLDGQVDVVVHCLKDLPGDRPITAGTQLAGYLKRDDVRDVLVHRGGLSLAELPEGTRIGSSSVRRIAQLHRINPGLVAVPIRGNVNSRLAKLDAGECDALVLARSGLLRIGEEAAITQVFSVDLMAPPVGAGILALQCRDDDLVAKSLIRLLNHLETEVEARAERALLAVLNGSCNSPISGHAQVRGGTLELSAAVFSPDGSEEFDGRLIGSSADPEGLGSYVANRLIVQGARRFLEGEPV